MNVRTASRTGLALYAGISLLVVAGGVFVARRPWRMGLAPVGPAVECALEATPPPEARPAPIARPNEVRLGTAAREGSNVVEALVDRLVDLLTRDPTDVDEDEIAHLVGALVTEGEVAGALLVARIDALRGVAATRRDRLLDVLRRLPGRAAEDRLIREARSGAADSSRALAIESLAERRTDRAVDALARIAQTDSEVPRRSLISAPRDPSDTSTELPDEVVFTPRMKAMSALASTHEPRAAEVLTGVLRDGPDESLRMEAARHLETMREMPGTVDALRAAAAGDPSAYVRLSALHALAQSNDRTLVPLLQAIATRDIDAGVRALASRVLTSFAQ